MNEILRVETPFRSIVILVENSRRKQLAWGAFLAASLALHLVLFAGARRAVDLVGEKETTPKIINVSTFKPPEKVQPPAPPPEVISKPLQTRKPRARAEKPVSQQKATPPEIRGGLSQSSVVGNGAAGIAAAMGNSAEAAVDPESARRPPPPPIAEVSEADLPISEEMADTPATCPTPPLLSLSEDAINAGVTSGTVIVTVSLDAQGKVSEAVLTKATGYEIDQLALAAAKKMTCTPAMVSGKARPVKNRQIKWNIVLD